VKLAVVRLGSDVDMVMERIIDLIRNTGQDELLEVESMNIWLLIMHKRTFEFESHE
jgi:hypothetical protein